MNTKCTITIGQANAFAGTLAFCQRLNQLIKSKRACKQTHKDSANFERHNFDRKEAQQVTWVLLQVGLDVETSAVCIAVLLFRQTNIYLAFCC